jgi:hypothetical protein
VRRLPVGVVGVGASSVCYRVTRSVVGAGRRACCCAAAPARCQLARVQPAQPVRFRRTHVLHVPVAAATEFASPRDTHANTGERTCAIGRACATKSITELQPAAHLGSRSNLYDAPVAGVTRPVSPRPRPRAAIHTSRLVELNTRPRDPASQVRAAYDKKTSLISAREYVWQLLR